MKLNVKLILFVLSLFLLLNQIQAQHPFYDAKDLGEAMNKFYEETSKRLQLKEEKEKMKPGFDPIVWQKKAGKSEKEIIKAVSDVVQILKKYENKVENLNDAQKVFKPNPFLIGYIDKIKEELKTLKDEGIDIKGLEQALKVAPKAIPEVAPSPAKGFPSPVMVVDALGSFIAKRFKEELTIAYLSNFKKKLNDIPELKTLFPTSIEYLKQMDIEDIYKFKQFLTTLRQFFLNDLNNMDEAVIELLKSDKENEKIKIDSQTKNLILLSLEIFKSLKNGEHPVEVISNLDKPEYSEYLNELDLKYANPLRLLALASRNLQNKEGNGWIKPVEFAIFFKESSRSLHQLFLGLVYAREKENLESITVNEKKLGDIIVENSLNIIQFDKSIKKAVGDINKFLVTAKNLQNQVIGMENKNISGFEKYHQYLSNALEMVNLGFEIKDIFADKEDENFKKYSDIAKKLLEIAKNIHDKAYGVALVKSVDVLEQVLSKSPARKEILKYGTFVVNMASAQSSEEMGKVIEAAALPVGSYRIKRTRAFTISLNSYAGIFGNREGQNGIEDDEDRITNIAFTAPVGLAFNIGLKGNEKSGSSLSLFGSFIDVGAVVRYRLSGEEKSLSEVTWKDIFAPGLFLIYGFKNSPLCLGFGVQLAPKLTKILDDAELEIKPSRVRWGVMIAVDIPIFHFK